MGEARGQGGPFRSLRLALGATLIIVTSVVLIWRARGAGWGDSPVKAQRVAVLPFSHSSFSGSVAGLAESLAAQLRAIPALDARVGQGSVAEADYLLDGDVTGDNGRVAIALRLRPAGQRAASWTATFWRRTLADSTLSRDLARAVAEALSVSRP